MAELSRAEKKALRELAGAAYEAEARLALDELDAHFQRWREGETLGSELIAAIHEFHQQDARVLWSTYQALKEPDIVARGLALGLIEVDSVPDQLRSKLAPLVAHFSRSSA